LFLRYATLEAIFPCFSPSIFIFIANEFRSFLSAATIRAFFPLLDQKLTAANTLCSSFWFPISTTKIRTLPLLLVPFTVLRLDSLPQFFTRAGRPFCVGSSLSKPRSATASTSVPGVPSYINFRCGGLGKLSLLCVHVCILSFFRLELQPYAPSNFFSPVFNSWQVKLTFAYHALKRVPLLPLVPLSS